MPRTFEQLKEQFNAISQSNQDTAEIDAAFKLLLSSRLTEPNTKDKLLKFICNKKLQK